ncbi:MAG: thioredoxin family protein [bacterium]
MEVVKNIKQDEVAFYIGTAIMCKKCEINYDKINLIKKYFSYINFYKMNADEVENLINEYRITNAPFFIISVKGEVKEIFYNIDDITSLTTKLLSYKGEQYEEKHTNTFL